MEWVLYGESSHADSIMTTRNGFEGDVAQAMGVAIHELVQR